MFKNFLAHCFHAFGLYHEKKLWKRIILLFERFKSLRFQKAFNKKYIVSSQALTKSVVTCDGMEWCLQGERAMLIWTIHIHHSLNYKGQGSCHSSVSPYFSPIHFGRWVWHGVRYLSSFSYYCTPPLRAWFAISITGAGKRNSIYQMQQLHWTPFRCSIFYEHIKIIKRLQSSKRRGTQFVDMCVPTTSPFYKQTIELECFTRFHILMFLEKPKLWTSQYWTSSVIQIVVHKHLLNCFFNMNKSVLIIKNSQIPIFY